MRTAAAVALTLGLAACGAQPSIDAALQRMRQQPRYDPYGRSRFFANGAVMQAPPTGTVPWSAGADLRLGPGRERNGADVREPPLPVTEALLARGKSRFHIFCAVCHGAGGYGGSIVASNMVDRRPPSLRRAGLSELPAGYFYQVVSGGMGRMPSYATELSVDDRWAVIAYLRQLQMRPEAGTPEQREDSIAAARLHQLDSLKAVAP